MNTPSLILHSLVAVFATWTSVSVAQTPATLGIQLDGGHLGITISGQVGQVYQLESTTKLGPPTVWTPFDYLKLSASPYLYMDKRESVAISRFYRTRESNVLPVPDMVYIPPGTFMMGSPESEVERGLDETQHQVTLRQEFWIGRYLVTQGDYKEVMGSNPSYFRNGVDGSTYGGSGTVITNELRHPVDHVYWEDATNYCSKLTQRERVVGRIPFGWKYRLPTEAEWEYACRAGTTTAFHYGPALRQGMANFYALYEYDSTLGSHYKQSNTFLGRTTEVGSYAPNAYGLYDMHGNVWEWCSDWYGNYPGTVTDPFGPTAGSCRILRGGRWGNRGNHCRSAYRHCEDPGYGFIYVGFRVVLSPGP